MGRYERLCPCCEEYSLEPYEAVGEYETEHGQLSCNECGAVFYLVDGDLFTPGEYTDMLSVSGLLPNESYEAYAECEDFD